LVFIRSMCGGGFVGKWLKTRSRFVKKHELTRSSWWMACQSSSFCFPLCHVYPLYSIIFHHQYIMQILQHGSSVVFLTLSIFKNILILIF